MKNVFLIITNLLGILTLSFGQRIPQVPDSVRKNYKILQANSSAKNNIDYSLLNKDSLIKSRLIVLALANPAMNIANANVRISEADLARAKTSWLGSFTLGANVNEFVISGSAAASFFPKYNLGLIVPFDIFSKLKRDKTVAKENLTINDEYLKEKEKELIALVLIAYETYKEKKEIVFLQRNSIEYDFSAYEAAKTSYADGDAALEDMNKVHQAYLNEKAKLVSKEKELNVSIILLEQIIGVPLSEVIKLQ
ncbi:MAG: TolC family protein [Gloeobacteraceae cyanobacterium ES-bin-316]|nr:TolC family protein [Ferruginibacter sp.]